MEAASAAKRARLRKLRYTLPHMTQTALSAVLKETSAALPDEGPIEASRQEIRDSRNEVALQMTPYGKLHRETQLPLASGAFLMVEMAALAPSLYVACHTASFSTLVLDTLRTVESTPEKPWGLIVYGDEIVPGNIIAPDNLRKSWVLYWSVREFGPDVLAIEDSWFVGCVIRTCKVMGIVGGFSAIVGSFLRLAFNASEIDVRTAGVSLRTASGEMVRLFFEVVCIVGDEDALRQVWRCKGAGGTHLCLLCINVVQYKASKEGDASKLTSYLTYYSLQRL